MSTSREHPILFSGEMVKALLEERKSQTRRVVNLPGYDGGGVYETRDARVVSVLALSPYGGAGAHLYVREKWRVIPSDNGHDFAVEYAAGGDLQHWRDGELRYQHLWADLYEGGNCTPAVQASECRWRPSIHLPRAFSRLTLEITSIRVERLTAISEEDARAEGFDPNWLYAREFGVGPLDWFSFTWNGINGKRPGCSWAANPWVWVLEFRRVEP